MPSFLRTCNFLLFFLTCVVHCAADECTNPTQEIEPYTQDELNAMRKAGLELHNYWRNLHGVPPLVLSDELNARAQLRADCRLKGGNTVLTTKAETLGWFTSRAHKNGTEMALRAINSHYTSYCHARPNGYPPEMLIFFQAIIWKSHTKIGLGISRGAKEWQGMVTMDYSPMSSGGGSNKREIRYLKPVVDNLICCRNKDPKGGGQLRKDVPDKERLEKCFQLPLDNDNGDNGDNGGGGDRDWWKTANVHRFGGGGVFGYQTKEKPNFGARHG